MDIGRYALTLWIRAGLLILIACQLGDTEGEGCHDFADGET